MKLRIVLSFVAILFTQIMYGQIVVALHSTANGVKYFSDDSPFNSAYEAAVDNDTIYLAGGSFVPPTLIEKKLVIYGVGHYEGASTATRITTINGSLKLGDGADGTHLEGLLVTGTLSFKDNEAINDVVIKRCNIKGTVYINGTMTTPSESVVFIENVLSGLNLSNLENSIFYNNIIQGTIDKLVNVTLLNNNFLYNGYRSSYVINYASNCMFKNNIFSKNYYSDHVCSGSGASTWSNNFFISTNPILGTNSTTSNNYTVVLSEIYVNQSGDSFSYEHDYHLQPGVATNLGDDGKEVGIYGGYHPWKTSSIPVIPHISNNNINSTSTEDGKLHIDITVEAQDR
jgi:hypothetical protein